MRSKIIIALTLAASALALPATGSAQECLSSAKAVRAAHGVEAWSTYKTINGRKCWMEGARPDARSHVSRVRRDGADARHADVIPLPKERPSSASALTPKRVWTVPAPALPWPIPVTEAGPERKEAATARTMNAAWTDGFDASSKREALFPPDALQEPATFRPAVFTQTIVVPREPTSMTALNALILLFGAVFAAVVWWLPRCMGRAMAAAGI